MASGSNDEGRRDDGHSDSSSVLRHEEELRLDVAPREAGSVRAATSVESVRVRESFPRQVERVQTIDRLPAEAGDSGQIETLQDGSISIPVFEEELVVTKRLVVRERVIVRKVTVTEHQAVEADLRRERIDVEVEERPPLEGPLA